MNMLSRYVSFEEPLGELLTKILFYLSALAIVLRGVERLWHWITWFDEDWAEALWGLIATPVRVIIALLVARVIAELVLAVLSLQKRRV